MNQTTMCIFSGLFGALFAVSCGVVDGIGNKEALADDVFLRKYVAAGSCTFDSDLRPIYGQDYDVAMSEIQNNEAVFSALEMCACYATEGGGCEPEFYSDSWKIAYIY